MLYECLLGPGDRFFLAADSTKLTLLSLPSVNLPRGDEVKLNDESVL